MKMKHWVIGAIVLVVMALIYTQLSFFVVPPIGALPEGKTVLLLRHGKMNFIDSPDGMCDRMQGGVSLMCRGMALGAVVEQSTILLRMPFSSTLYSISTGGKTYEH